MLGISRQTDYATRLVLHLAGLAPGTRVSIAEISRIQQLPVPFVRRLVGLLIQAGLVVSTRGAGGGLRLAREAREISLLQVVEAVEGTLALNHCVGNLKACARAEHCPGHPAWTQATLILVRHLGAVDFATLASEPKGQARARVRAQAASI